MGVSCRADPAPAQNNSVGGRPSKRDQLDKKENLTLKTKFDSPPPPPHRVKKRFLHMACTCCSEEHHDDASLFKLCTGRHICTCEPCQLPSCTFCIPNQRKGDPFCCEGISGICTSCSTSNCCYQVSDLSKCSPSDCMKCSCSDGKSTCVCCRQCSCEIQLGCCRSGSCCAAGLCGLSCLRCTTGSCRCSDSLCGKCFLSCTSCGGCDGIKCKACSGSSCCTGCLSCKKAGPTCSCADAISLIVGFALWLLDVLLWIILLGPFRACGIACLWICNHRHHSFPQVNRIGQKNVIIHPSPMPLRLFHFALQFSPPEFHGHCLNALNRRRRLK